MDEQKNIIFKQKYSNYYTIREHLYYNLKVFHVDYRLKLYMYIYTAIYIFIYLFIGGMRENGFIKKI